MTSLRPSRRRSNPVNCSSVKRSIRQVQRTQTDQPRALSNLTFRRSRRRFDSIFSVQNRTFVDGALAALHVWPCQKQPRTSIARRRDATTMSGRPGSVLTWLRDLTPILESTLRTRRSGCVFTDLIRAITSERALRLRISMRSCGAITSWLASTQKPPRSDRLKHKRPVTSPYWRTWTTDGSITSAWDPRRCMFPGIAAVIFLPSR